MNGIEYVFYSGGFDTTYYLLECLLVKKIKVQPRVVKVRYIDGVNLKRISQYQEEVSRNNFYSNFKKKYPNLQKNLLKEIVYVNQTTLNDDTLELGKLAFKKNIFSREVNQLLYFHQVCKDNNFNSTVVGYQKDDNLSNEGVEFLKNELGFKIPMANITKKKMLDNAIKNGFDSFLYETWSCWNPLPGNKPCKKCELCKKTIVDTKLDFNKTLI